MLPSLSVLHKYEFDDWNNVVGVDNKDLPSFVQSFSYKRNGVALALKKNGRGGFRCWYNYTHCKQFQLLFRRSSYLPHSKWNIQPKETIEHSNDCLANKDKHKIPSTTILRNHPDFVSYMMINAGIATPTTVKQHMKTKGHTVLLSPSSLSHLIQAFKGDLRDYNDALYKLLPAYFTELQQADPDGVSRLENDSEGRFYRMAYISSIVAAQVGHITLRNLHMDACFSTIFFYDGVLFVLVLQDGNGFCVDLGIILLPIEMGEHGTYVVQLLVHAGINIEEMAVWVDRGNFLSAAAALAALPVHDPWYLTLSLKYCLEHIFKNIVHTFRLKSNDTITLRPMLQKAQAARCVDRHFYALSKIEEYKFANDDHTGLKIVNYLQRIHPLHWAVFANSPRS